MLGQKLADKLHRERLRRYAAYVEEGGRQRDGPWTLLRISRKIGVSPNTLHNWESDVCEPSTLDAWVYWAKALKMDFATMLRDEMDRAVR